MNKEIKDFAIKHFLAPRTNEVIEKSKYYYELVKKGKVKLDEHCTSILYSLASHNEQLNKVNMPE